MTSEIEDLSESIRKMIDGTHALLGPIIEEVRPSYQRARRAKSEWTEHHPLLVLLDAAEESLRSMPRSTREPWLLAQLSNYLQTVRKWRQDPGWKDIEPYLVNPSDFSHMMAMLTVAERLRAWGHNVQLVSTGQEASPDLRVQAKGGRQEWLQIECYCPRTLNGKPVRLSPADSHKIIREAMKKAKLQLGNERPGIIAICMYNQPRSNIDLIKETIETRLRQTPRDSLAGFIVLCQNNLVTNHEGKISFTPSIHLDLLQNPSYFGSISFSSDVPKDSPGSLIGPEINEPLKEIIVNDYVLLQREIQRAPSIPQLNPALGEEESVVATKIESLPILKGPIQDRAVFTWSGESNSAYFEGDGNIDFQCGNCSRILARRIWKPSCSNIVLQCETCGLYNEFPPQDLSRFLKTNNIAVEANDTPYRCATVMVMKRGICLIGVEHDYHLQFPRRGESQTNDHEVAVRTIDLH